VTDGNEGRIVTDPNNLVNKKLRMYIKKISASTTRHIQPHVIPARKSTQPPGNFPVIPIFPCHSCESRSPAFQGSPTDTWIHAFAGMTGRGKGVAPPP
jgi:hypothetical protein